MKKEQPGFKAYDRQTRKKQEITERVKTYKEFYTPLTDSEMGEQAKRCMDCGVAYCNHACPLGNYLPDINALVSKQQFEKALKILLSTNNFPEFTGRLCPALCEAACTLGINYEPNANKEVELHLVEKGFEEGWIKPQLPLLKTGKNVAVVGSGPTGMAVAQQLIRAGHQVVVFERSESIGGILALGIPDYKLEKDIIQRRVKQLKAEGIVFKTNTNVGVDISVEELKQKYDAICLCGGSTVPRDLDVNGRQLKGVHFAMDYLTQQNKRNIGEQVSVDEISAKDKNVIIIGGGDTGADCLGVAIRQGAKTVRQIELMPKPPLARNEEMPWPEWPMILRNNTSHEEGGERQWSIGTKYFSGSNGKVEKIHCIKTEWAHDTTGRKIMKEIEGSEFEIDAELIIFAMGFVHPEKEDLIKKIQVKLDQRGNVETNEDKMTNVAGIFAAGDMRTGQSLVCRCIADGRETADKIDQYLRNK